MDLLSIYFSFLFVGCGVPPPVGCGVVPLPPPNLISFFSFPTSDARDLSSAGKSHKSKIGVLHKIELCSASLFGRGVMHSLFHV